MTPEEIDAMLGELEDEPGTATGADDAAEDGAPGLGDVLAPLTTLGHSAPAPSPELAALLAGRTAGAPRALSTTGEQGRSRSGAWVGALVLAVSGVGATGLSAAADTLPTPWQQRAAELSREHLPFAFPEPRREHRVPTVLLPGPADAADHDPVPRVLRPADEDRGAAADHSAEPGPRTPEARAQPAPRDAAPAPTRRLPRAVPGPSSTAEDSVADRPSVSATPERNDGAGPGAGKAAGTRPAPTPDGPDDRTDDRAEDRADDADDRTADRAQRVAPARGDSDDEPTSQPEDRASRR